MGLSISKSIIEAHRGRMWASRGAAGAAGDVTSGDAPARPGLTVNVALPLARRTA
jgi:signal transduction histidine kinase